MQTSTDPVAQTHQTFKIKGDCAWTLSWNISTALCPFMRSAMVAGGRSHMLPSHLAFLHVRRLHIKRIRLLRLECHVYRLAREYLRSMEGFDLDLWNFGFFRGSVNVTPALLRHEQ